MPHVAERTIAGPPTGMMQLTRSYSSRVQVRLHASGMSLLAVMRGQGGIFVQIQIPDCQSVAASQSAGRGDGTVWGAKLLVYKPLQTAGMMPAIA